MKRKDKKFEYRDKSLAKLDWNWNKKPLFDLADIAKTFDVPPLVIGKVEPVASIAISKELAEDSIVALEPFFANAFSDAFKSAAEDAESFSATMKEFGDKIREGVQESVAKGLVEALTFDDIRSAMFKIDEQTKAKGIFQMSPEAYDKIQAALGDAVGEYDKQKEEERREREEQFEKLLRTAEGIERERNLDLLKIKKKILELRNPTEPDDDEVYFDSGTRAVRVRENMGGVLVPGDVASSITRITGEQSIVRQVVRTIPFERYELLEVSAVPPTDPNDVSAGPLFSADVRAPIPAGAIVAFDGGEIPAGWAPVEGAPGKFIKKLA